MAKKKLRVGVVGVGAIAHDQHLPYWKELEAEDGLAFSVKVPFCE